MIHLLAYALLRIIPSLIDVTKYVASRTCGRVFKKLKLFEHPNGLTEGPHPALNFLLAEDWPL